jgi:hypothetical protein
VQLQDLSLHRRDRHRGWLVGLPPLIRGGLVDLLKAVFEGLHREAHPAPLQGQELRRRGRAEEGHVGRAPVLREHVDVGEGRLELRGDDARDHGDVIRDAVEDGDIPGRDEGLAGLQGVDGEEPQPTHGGAQVEGKERDPVEDLRVGHELDVRGELGQALLV